MKSFGFRKFVGMGFHPRIDIYLEGMGDRTKDIDMPLPSSIINLISSVPSAGLRANYANALQWVFNQGLYEASKKRHLLAKQASQLPVDLGNGRTGTLGQKIAMLAQKQGKPERERVQDDQTKEWYYPIYDHEMFSKEAHDFFAQNGVPELKQFYDETYGSNPEDYEPKFMQFKFPNTLGVSQNTSDPNSTRRSSGVQIPLKELNSILESQGMQPFKFGGYGGLIEYMENGSWAPSRSVYSPSEFNHSIRNGLDLSNPKRFIDKRKEGAHVIYKFSDFNPPKNIRNYNRTVDKTFRYTINLFKRKDQVDGLTQEEKDYLDNLQKAQIQLAGYRGTVDDAAQIWDDPAEGDSPAFDNRSGRIHNFSDNANLYAAIKFLVMLGMEEYKENPNSIKGETPDLNWVFSKIFPSPGRIAARYQKNNKAKADRKSSTDTWINLGASRLKRIFHDPSATDSVLGDLEQMIKKGDFGPNENLDIYEILNNLEKAMKHDRTRELKVPAVPSDYSYAKIVPYHQHTVKTTPEAIQQMFDQGFRLVRSSEEKQRGASNIEIPDRNSFEISFGDKVYSIKKDQFDQYWLSDLDTAQDQPISIPNKMKKVPKPLLAPGAKMRLNSLEPETTPLPKHMQNQLLDMMEQDPERFGNLNSLRFSQSSQIPDSIFKSYSRDDIKNLALQGLVRHANNYAFYYGALNSSKLKKHFDAVGLTDDTQQQKAIDFMRSAQYRRWSIKQIDDFLKENSIPNGELIWKAFILNSKQWRKQKMNDHAASLIRQEVGKERGYGSAGEDEEGNEIEDSNMDLAAGNRQSQFSVSSSRGANLKRDIYSGDYVTDDIEEAPELGDVKDIIQKSGSFSNKNNPFSTERQVKLLQTYPSDRSSRDEYNRFYFNGYNSVSNSTENLDGMELAGVLKQKMLFLTRATDKPPYNTQSYKDGVKDAVADNVHRSVYSYINSGGSKPYPEALVQMFLKGSGTFSISQDYPEQVSAMLKDLNDFQNPQQSPESMPIYPTVYIKDPSTGQTHQFSNPQDLKVAYDNAQSNPQGNYLAAAIKSAVISAANAEPHKYKEFLRIVSGPDSGLRKAVSQVPQPVKPQAPSAWSSGMFGDDDDFASQPVKPQAPSAWSPQPQVPQPVKPQAPSAWSSGMFGDDDDDFASPQIPKRPFPGPNESTMESFREYCLRHANLIHD